MAHKKSESHTSTYALHIGIRGRIVLPAAVRKHTGLQDGDALLLTVETDGSLRLIDARRVAHQGRGLFQPRVPAAHNQVDEFIAARRAEAARENR